MGASRAPLRTFALVLSHQLLLCCYALGGRQSVPSSLPGNWTTIGCYTDNTGARTLTGASFVDPVNMTVENCISFCDSKHFVFAGVEFMQECYCDNFIENSGTTAPITDCNQVCAGNSGEFCGGSGRLNIFWSGAEPPPPPTIPHSIGKWESLGCYSDNTNGQGRSLVDKVDVTGQVSLETCTAACFSAGMPFSGAEFADECYCGPAVDNGGELESVSDCNMLCAGNSSEFCGGPNRLTVYNYTGSDLPPPPVGGGGGGGATGGASAIATDLPEPWAYVGCFVDNAHGRVLTVEADNANMTMESCVASCDAQNFTIAGGEFSVQCFCGDALIRGAVRASESDCSSPCGGNSTQACGAGDRLSIYSTTQNITVIPIPTPQNTSIPGSWSYQGCLAEGDNADIFPWEIQMNINNSAPGCLSQCAAFGYTAGGMEFGNRCYCGDESDVTKSGFGLTTETECDNVCTGDPAHLCGGVFRIQYYLWTGPAHVWHTPAITGRYEFFVPGVVVPLIATVGINNKVTFLEKSGTSEFDNSTGAYELDLSLASNFSTAWRAMHVKSDVFCSGSVTLPDKHGRQLNVGGWSLDSTKGVRLYTPDGSPGVNGTNDWEENFQELHLQRQRWYPTAAMLPNGTVMVIGGETGSNGSPEPNVEILPTPKGGDTVIFLDWLNRTDPNNLYPFVFVLPSGNLFVVYYNEARILNAKTFNTVIQLPNIPASVSSFLGGRTYPLEGAASLFPLYAPYTNPLEVLICGGSTPGPGTALDNCVSIQPEAKNVTWTIERMPSPRVMPCMVGLPDGTFLIVNGGIEGVAGFNLSSHPNLGALLYDPSMPVNQRISILNTTIVARLYHSEAILLPDGRVLISGSDPQSIFNPEEFRIEVYIPPYLAQGRIQPSFNITQTDWAYGSQNSITVTLHQGTTSTMKVSLVSATSSTHGNTMGSRTIFPAFSCVRNTCTITAPPNAFVSPPGWHQLFILDGPTPSHSSWVRIGGDPAGIGNWPNLPGFTLPGV
ncbi:glyoxal oxidase N-terminus-domain-containing protein [Mycena albidolilacea]|uniref:Glyoxal oxidase N-terminus-domain-containing protein n=1 Tax=Mycena albidolilacea TaxID=1033008 RepID=A0AAD7F1V9_9AGAR|nr:glyoxal oxidase N-terminus-domain-containing protein [Mycena albidolilacea]